MKKYSLLDEEKQRIWMISVDDLIDFLSGMGMELPPKNEDDRPYAEGFNDAVKHIKEQIEHL